MTDGTVQFIDRRDATLGCDLIKCGLRNTEIYDVKRTPDVCPPSAPHVIDMQHTGFKHTGRFMLVTTPDVIVVELFQMNAGDVTSTLGRAIGHSMTRCFSGDVGNYKIFAWNGPDRQLLHQIHTIASSLGENDARIGLAAGLPPD